MFYFIIKSTEIFILTFNVMWVVRLNYEASGWNNVIYRMNVDGTMKTVSDRTVMDVK